MARERVTFTRPVDLVENIDRRERNRSRFITEAVRRELKRRRREDLKRSLESPHPETSELAGEGLDDWAARMPAEKASDLLDLRAGCPVRWVPGRGWTVRR